MKKILIGLFVITIYALGNQLQWDCTDKVFELNYQLEEVKKLSNPTKIDKLRDLLNTIYEVSGECKSTDVNKDFDLNGGEFLGTDNLKKEIKKIIKESNKKTTKDSDNISNKNLKKLTALHVKDYIIKGNGEECRIRFDTHNNTMLQSTCISLTNSKGVKIYCTKNKEMCKTEQEINEAVKQPQIHNSVQKSKTATNKKAMKLLRTFAIDESTNYNMYDWTTGTNKAFIDWRYTGIKEALAYNGKPRTDYSYKREGIATIENDAKWNITLLGARGGYLIVELDTGLISENSAKLVLDEKHVLKEKHCEESASYNTSRYLIKFENKKPFWLQEMYSSGSGGGSYSYTILYDNKPKCETEAKEDKNLYNTSNNSSKTERTTEANFENNQNTWSYEEASKICSDSNVQKTVSDSLIREVMKSKRILGRTQSGGYKIRRPNPKALQGPKLTLIRVNNVDSQARKVFCGSTITFSTGFVVDVKYTVQRTIDGEQYIYVTWEKNPFLD